MKLKNLKVKTMWLIIGLAFLAIIGLNYVTNLSPASIVIQESGSCQIREYDLTRGVKYGVNCGSAQYYYGTDINAAKAELRNVSVISTSTGTIKIWSYPDGAEIFVDNKPYGLTTSDKHIMVTTTLGKHTVILRKADYSFYTQEIDVTSIPTKIDAYLKSNKPNTPLSQATSQTTSQIECPETHPFYDKETNSCYSDTPILPSISSVGIIGVLIITTLLIKRRKI